MAGQVVIPSTVTSIDLSGTGNVPLFDAVARIPLFAGDAAAASADPRVISFTPRPDFVGVAEFPFRVTDGGLESNTGVLRIEVGDVNSRPSFTAANVHVDHDSGPQTIANWVTAFDPGGPEETAQQPLAYNITAIGDASLFAVPSAVSPNGTLTFTPAAGVEGETTITVTVQDDGGTSNGGIDISLPQVFSIRIGNPNRQPSFSASAPPAIDEDAGPQTRAGWASFNPGDASESQQRPTYLISNVSNPSLFSAAPSVAADGTLTYTPAADANGSSTFVVRVQDDGGTSFGGVDTSAPQTFTVTINPVNDAPTFTASFADNQTATVVLNPLQPCCVHQEFPGFVSAFSPGPANEAGQSLVRYTVQRLDSLLNQSVSIDNSGKLIANLTYVLGGVSFEGAVQFRVTAEDDGGTAGGGVNSSTSQIYTILVTRLGTLNAPPSVTAPTLTVRPEDAGSVSVPGWAQFQKGVDAFPNAAVLRYIVSNISNATLFSTPPAVANNGTLTFTSAPNAFGTATFDLQVQDNGGTQNGGVDTSGAQQFTISIDARNDRPSFTAPSVTEVNEDAGQVVIPNWVTSFDPGPNEMLQHVRNYVAVSESFTIHEASFDLFAEAPTIGNNGELRFRVKPNVFGDLYFNAAVVDDGGPGIFPDPINVNQSSFQSFIVRVLPVNDAPRYIGPTELTIAETAVPQRFEKFAAAVPGQDNEAGQAVAEYRITANDNEVMFAELPKIDVDGTLTFTLKPNAFGTANLTAIVKDTGGTDRGGVDTSPPAMITIQVTDIDDTPIVGQILAPASVRDKMLVPLSITANTRTGDVSQLTYEWTITPPVGDPVQRSGKEIEVTFEEPGPHQVQTRVSNPQGDQVTRTVTLDVLPSTPTIDALMVSTLALLGQEVVLRAAASDPVSSADAVVLNWSVTNLVSGNTQTFAGAEFRFAAAAGGYDVELTATTAVGGTASRMQQIRVLAVETPAAGTEDEPSTLRVTDTNPNSSTDDLSVLWTVTPSGGEEVALLGSPADYVPFDGGEVVVTATIGAPFGGLLNIDARTITVAAVNDAPMLNPIGAQSTPEGQLLTFTATATDIDSATLTFSLDAGAPAGTSIDPVTGVFTWTPTEAQGPGTFDVTIRVTDDGTPSLSHSEKIAITVAEMNQAPVLAAIGNKVVDEGNLLTFTANASDADDPANTLTYSLNAGSPAGAKIDPVTGVFTWTPTATQGPGTFEVTVRVSDDGAPNLFSESTFAIQVNDLAPWTNLADPLDATADGFISPLDVLVIINDLNDVGPRQLVGAPSALQFFLDVNKDGFVTPVDALIVINRLNEPPASLEGEYSRPQVFASDSVLGALVTPLAPAASAVSTNSRTAAIEELLHDSGRCLGVSDLELSLGLIVEDIAAVLLRRTRLPRSA